MRTYEFFVLFWSALILTLISGSNQRRGSSILVSGKVQLLQDAVAICNDFRVNQVWGLSAKRYLWQCNR